MTDYQTKLIKNLTKKENEHSIAKRGASKGLLLWNNLPSGNKFIIPYTISPNLGKNELLEYLWIILSKL